MTWIRDRGGARRRSASSAPEPRGASSVGCWPRPGWTWSCWRRAPGTPTRARTSPRTSWRCRRPGGPRASTASRAMPGAAASARATAWAAGRSSGRARPSVSWTTISACSASTASCRAPASRTGRPAPAEMAPYYDAAEAHVGVAGALGPWDPPDRKPYPLPPHGLHHHSVVLRDGLHAAGAARPSRPDGHRLAAAAEPRGLLLLWVLHPGLPHGRDVQPRHGRAALGPGDGPRAAPPRRRRPARRDRRRRGDRRSVEYGYRPDGSRHREPAEIVVVASNPLEIPRLLLNSRSAAHPRGSRTAATRWAAT